MKRPISILCLADIHYNDSGDMKEVDSLCEELIEYTTNDNQNVKWRPDYIVVAGDIADKNSGYTGATDFINKLKNGFGIDSQNIIIVPGNHDKDVKNLSKEMMSNQKSTFNLYCKKLDKEAFGNVFMSSFKNFIKFSKEYNENLQFYKVGKDCILDERLHGLSGVKVFKENHICFLHVNTEWLYMSGKDKTKVFSERYEDFTDFMRVDEDCRLCAPLIKDAYRLIKTKYPDYTVVTVMHRGFEHFSYGEKNVSDATTIDAIEYIIRVSDIIITGHDHIFSPAPPTLIGNRVQHFQLGSVGRKESAVSELSRFAEVIRIDVPNGDIEQLFIQHRKGRDNFHWDIYASDRKYSLFSKFPQRNGIRLQYSDTVLRSPSSYKMDIKKSISLHFQFPTKPLIIHADNMIKNSLEKLIKSKAKKLYIVVYYLYHEYLNQDFTNNIKRQLDLFRDKNIKKILFNKIVISEVIVEYPLW